MANIKSAKKRIRVTKTKTSQNNFWKKAVKSAVSGLQKSITSKTDKKEIETMNNKLKSVVDKAAKKRVISKSKAARIKSKFQKAI